MLAWVNGSLVPEERATVSVLDRGFLFGDGVYEVVRYFAGYGVALDLHTERLERSLQQVGIAGFDARQLGTIATALLEANSLADATLYLQVTRGAGTSRAHLPAPGLVPTVVALATPAPALEQFTAPETMRLVTLPDPRWSRCDIKTVSLAGNLLCLMAAKAAGADECVLVRDGLVGEGASVNLGAVVRGQFRTCGLDSESTPVLHGTMRAWALEAARAAGVPASEGPLHHRELLEASEVIVMSTRRLAAAATHVDGRPVGDGGVGPVCRALFHGMRERIAREVWARTGTLIDSRHVHASGH
jgi:D-alanine transaminase